MDHYTRQKEVILKHTPTMSLYLKKLNENEKERALNVFATWELSFRQILGGNDTGQLEADFLTLFAFFDCQDISENLFAVFAVCADKPPLLYEEIKDHIADLGSNFKLLRKDGKWDRDKFRNILANLAQSALVQTWTPSSDSSDNWSHLTLHPLIQDWILLRTDPKTFAQYYVIAAVCISWLLNFCWSFDKLALGRPMKGIKECMPSHIGAHIKHRNSLIEQGNFPVGNFKEQMLTNEAEFCMAMFMCQSGQHDRARIINEQVIEWQQANLGVCTVLYISFNSCTQNPALSSRGTKKPAF